MEFSEIVQKRYATKQFTGEQIPEDKIDALLEIIRMSASSFGLQPWKVKVIFDKETKDMLLAHSYNQPQVTSCSHLLVFCANTNVTAQIDKYEQLLKDAGTPEEKVTGYIGIMRGAEKGMTDEQKLTWAQKQVYIAIGNAINGAKSLGFDSCPMEGFDSGKYNEILNLPDNLKATVIVPVGIAADKPNPKIRFSKEELFF